MKIKKRVLLLPFCSKPKPYFLGYDISSVDFNLHKPPKFVAGQLAMAR